MIYSIRPMKTSDLKYVFGLIEQDFIPGEYAPYETILRQLENNEIDGFIYEYYGAFAAYALCIPSRSNGFVLLSLLAVERKLRGQGIGAAFLTDIIKKYGDKEGIIVEVEKPEEAESESEKSKRIKRVRFYEKLGFRLIKGIDYKIWGIRMHLMALSLKTSFEEIDTNIGQIIYDIYYEMLGDRFIHMLKFSRE